MAVLDMFALGPETHDVAVADLSGGQKKRLGLAAAFALQPDIILLDEPTNHLDIEGIDYLVQYLAETTSLTVVMVSHDRFLIQNVCDQIMEIDNRALEEYPIGASYDKYLDLRAQRLAAAEAIASAAQVKLRKESEWMRRQPKARSTKARYRVEAFSSLQEIAKGRGPDPRALSLSSEDGKGKQRRLGNLVAEFTDAAVSVSEGGRVLISGFTYEFRQNDRIGLVGPNGVGKSTFLEALVQRRPLSGGVMRLGETVCFGYFEQKGMDVTDKVANTAILQFVKETVEVGVEGSAQAVRESEAMQLLNRFQFPAKRWFDKVGSLSGGELRRLQLLTVLSMQPNFLVLDEPTNDLDLDTISALEEYLTEEYKGALVVVSHDRYFMDRVADHLFVLEGDQTVKNFEGDCSEYIDLKHAQDKAAAEAAAAAAKDAAAEAAKAQSPKQAPQAGLTREQQREMKRLEGQMEKLNAKVEVISAQLEADDGSDYVELQKLMDEASALQTQIAEKEDRWLELSELA